MTLVKCNSVIMLIWVCLVLTPGQAYSALAETEKEGVRVEFTLQSVASPEQDAFIAGKPHLFNFDIRDTTTGSPLKGLYPAAWVHSKMPGDEQAGKEQACKRKLSAFLGGSLFSQAEVDLNVYHVLTLNDDASVSVVDPLFGFGGSKLLNMVSLPGVGYDWVSNQQGDAVYVSIPERNALARINTYQWQVDATLEGEQWSQPGELAIQADQHYLWLAVADGIAVFEQAHFRFVKKISLASERETSNQKIALTEFVFSPDSRYLYVADKNNDVLHIIDTTTLTKLKTLDVGQQPAYMAYSELAQALYISHEGDGRVVVIDGHRHEIIAEQVSEPGLGMIRFEPRGRLAFMVNPTTNELSILDAAQNRIVQSGPVDKGPEAISFSDELAYIRHRGSHTVLMITLADPNIGREGRPIPVVDTPAGDHPPGDIAVPTPAPGIIQAPGADAVLIANSGDKTVYFYKEGMAAPMGQFGNYGKSPRAILAIDRSLKERQQDGSYQTVAKLPSKPGKYDVVYFMDTPRIIDCFEVQVETDQQLKPKNDAIAIQQLSASTKFLAGQEVSLQFKLQSVTASELEAKESSSLTAVVMLSSGIWSQRFNVHSDLDGKVKLDFTPPLAGVYRVYFDSDVLNLAPNRHRFVYEVLANDQALTLN